VNGHKKACPKAAKLFEAGQINIKKILVIN